MKRFKLLALISMFTALSLGSTVFAQEGGDIQKGDPGSKVIRVGVVLPKVELVDAKGEVEPGEALRSTYASLLNSDVFELVALKSRLASLALAEAEKLECDYILNVSLKQVTKKSGGGLFGRVLRDTGNRATWEASTKVPGAGSTGGRIARTTARSAIINTGYTMSNMSIKVRKNDKFTLNYGLITGKGKTVADKEFEAKAKKKNDDTVLMGLIEESANDIAEVLLAARAQ
ncbi:MAG: hypothetical protein HKN33_09655 [Pyrinomonadaceae bacterium]|nr:hypothetical protein [Pyrinomonadaceae bacterium]